MQITQANFRHKTIRRIINRKKRESRLVMYNGRMTKAWRVPGTRENGDVYMWECQLRP